MTRFPQISAWSRAARAAGCAMGLATLLLAAGCATRPDPVTEPEAYEEYVEINDPIEPVNRVIFEFNLFVDQLLIKPLGIFYRDILPPKVQTGIHNVLVNLRAPLTFFNEVLQGEFSRAGGTAGRFAVNSTLGVAGFLNIGEEFGLPQRDEDFGQTLGVWGVGDGPYLVLPLLGPSGVRDAVGRATDSIVLDPFGLLGAILENADFLTTFSFVRLGFTVADERARAIDPLEELERTSIDLYGAVRSAYRQNRAFQIENRSRSSAWTEDLPKDK